MFWGVGLSFHAFNESRPTCFIRENGEPAVCVIDGQYAVYLHSNSSFKLASEPVRGGGGGGGGTVAN